MFIFDREREHERGRGRERRRHRIWSRLQALSCQHSWHGAWTHEPWDHDLSQSQPFNLLSHPGTPVFKNVLWFVSLSVFILFLLPFPYAYLFYTLNSTYEWNNVFFFLWLTYFTQHNTFQFYPCCSKWQDFIPSHCQVVSHWIYKPHLLIHSAVDGYLFFSIIWLLLKVLL